MKILQFSGGLDSLATLWMLKPIWAELTVVWVDTGAAYPETRELVERIRDEIPVLGVVVVKGDQPKFISNYGFPVDIIPVDATAAGRQIRGTVGVNFVPSFMCCDANLWQPASRAVREMGATEVYRGQRDVDSRKSPIKSGHVEDGVMYLFPLEGWSRENVERYTARNCPDFVPAYYGAGEISSRDCWDCTAYLDDNSSRIQNLPREKKAVVQHRLAQLHELTAISQSLIAKIVGGSNGTTHA